MSYLLIFFDVLGSDRDGGPTDVDPGDVGITAVVQEHEGRLDRGTQGEGLAQIPGVRTFSPEMPYLVIVHRHHLKEMVE